MSEIGSSSGMAGSSAVAAPTMEGSHSQGFSSRSLGDFKPQGAENKGMVSLDHGRGQESPFARSESLTKQSKDEGSLFDLDRPVRDDSIIQHESPKTQTHNEKLTQIFGEKIEHPASIKEEKSEVQKSSMSELMRTTSPIWERPTEQKNVPNSSQNDGYIQLTMGESQIIRSNMTPRDHKSHQDNDSSNIESDINTSENNTNVASPQQIDAGLSDIEHPIENHSDLDGHSKTQPIDDTDTEDIRKTKTEETDLDYQRNIDSNTKSENQLQHDTSPEPQQETSTASQQTDEISHPEQISRPQIEIQTQQTAHLQNEKIPTPIPASKIETTVENIQAQIGLMNDTDEISIRVPKGIVMPELSDATTAQVMDTATLTEMIRTANAPAAITETQTALDHRTYAQPMVRTQEMVKPETILQPLPRTETRTKIQIQTEIAPRPETSAQTKTQVITETLPKDYPAAKTDLQTQTEQMPKPTEQTVQKIEKQIEKVPRDLSQSQEQENVSAHEKTNRHKKQHDDEEREPEAENIKPEKEVKLKIKKAWFEKDMLTNKYRRWEIIKAYVNVRYAWMRQLITRMDGADVANAIKKNRDGEKMESNSILRIEPDGSVNPFADTLKRAEELKSINEMNGLIEEAEEEYTATSFTTEPTEEIVDGEQIANVHNWQETFIANLEDEEVMVHMKNPYVKRPEFVRVEMGE